MPRGKIKPQRFNERKQTDESQKIDWLQTICIYMSSGCVTSILCGFSGAFAFENGLRRPLKR